MSLIQDLKDIQFNIDLLKSDIQIQQAIYFHLINGMVALHQKHRVAKEFILSDEVRNLLSNIGVKIVQGTDGMTLEQIRKVYKDVPQPSVGDTWTLDLNNARKNLLKEK